MQGQLPLLLTITDGKVLEGNVLDGFTLESSTFYLEDRVNIHSGGNTILIIVRPSFLRLGRITNLINETFVPKKTLKLLNLVVNTSNIPWLFLVSTTSSKDVQILLKELKEYLLKEKKLNKKNT